MKEWKLTREKDDSLQTFKIHFTDMKNILIFLVTGFEEIEALGTIDILRRGGLNVQSVSLTDSLQVVGSHQIPVTADLMFDDADFINTELLILPGGTVKINEHDGLKKQILAFVDQDKKVAAICAAPMVLGQLGLLKGRKATCYPGFEQYLTGATLTLDAVVVDGNFTTGRGPGLTFDFALEIVKQMAGQEKADEVAKGLLLK